VKVLVTGGRGFIGARLVLDLLAEGVDVRVLDDGSRGGAELPAEVDALDGDVRDAETVQATCRGVDAVVHLAAVQGTRNFYKFPDAVLDVNLRGVLNVAQGCAAEDVQRLVFSSSSEAYGIPSEFPTPESAPLVVPDPTNPRWSYAASKIAGELVVTHTARRHGFEYAILRYHNVYGPAMGWDHVIPEFISRLVRDEEFTVQGDGSQRRAFCYVDDAVTPTRAALTVDAAANGIFNVGNPAEEHSINDLIALLEGVTGRTIHPRYVPFEQAGTDRRVPDVSRAERALGLRPTVTLEDGLRRTYDWYAEQLLGAIG
jgi:dTDP-glucose 4,6-dehydratase/UDP-glucose 4-epimerase